jgi:hypothetical protein
MMHDLRRVADERVEFGVARDLGAGNVSFSI